MQAFVDYGEAKVPYLVVSGLLESFWNDVWDRGFHCSGPPVDVNIIQASGGGERETDGDVDERPSQNFEPEFTLPPAVKEAGINARAVLSFCVDASGLVYVGDRENSRIQVFLPDGQYVREWRGVHRPDHILQARDGQFYIAELGMRQGLSPSDPTPTPLSHPSGVKIMTSSGNWLGGWGMSTDTSGDVIAAHAIAVDSAGDLYVGETLEGARLQKYARVR